MAVVRPARSSPPYALIIFVFLSVIATGLAVYFYIEMGSYKKQLADHNETQKAIARPDESKSEVVRTLVAEGAKANRSALGQAVYLLERYRQKIDPTATGTGSVIVEDNGRIDLARKAVGQAEPALLKALDNVYQQSQENLNRIKQLEGQLATAQTEYKRAQQAYNTTLASYKRVADEQKTQIDRVSGDLTKTRTQIETTIKKYEGDKGTAQRSHEQELRNLLTKVRQAEDGLKQAGERVKTLEDQVAGMRPTNKTSVGSEGDAKIIRNGISQDEVYVNLGRKDRVTVGLTFAVYDPRLGVGSGVEGRGKGAIEIMDVGENESLARIIRFERGNSILSGDTIANPVFSRDRNRKYRFMVFGDFDLDGDGVATSAERDRVVRMIESWGGQIDAKLDTQTDFVVLGAEPSAQAARFSALSEQTADLVAQRKAQQEQYQQLAKDARAYSIPVLNANRFLAMIGYEASTIVKY